MILDPEILTEIQPWKEKYAAISETVIGYSPDFLSFTDCFSAECALGNFLADAFLQNGHVNGSGIDTISFMQAGGIRAPLPKGCE